MMEGLLDELGESTDAETEEVVPVRRVVAVAERRSNALRVAVPAPTTVNAVGTSRISSRIFY